MVSKSLVLDSICNLFTFLCIDYNNRVLGKIMEEKLLKIDSHVVIDLCENNSNRLLNVEKSKRERFLSRELISTRND